MKENKSVIIIGGGLAGLSAGVFCQLNGFQSQIYEQHTLPGGVCTAWRRNGFLIDGCIHWLMSCHPKSPLFQLYKQVGAFDMATPITIDKFGTYYYADTKTSKKIILSSNLQEVEKQWLEVAPEDTDIISQLIEGIRAFQAFDVDWSLSSGSITQRLLFYWKIRKLLRFFPKYSMSIDSYISRLKSPILKWHLQSIFLPEMPMIFFFMMLGQLTTQRLAGVKEGSLVFAQSIANRYKKLGGIIHYKKSVNKILTEGFGKRTRTTGIQCDDGTIYKADIIISACDGNTTLNKMLEGKHTTTLLQKMYKEWPIFKPILLVSLGFHSNLSELEESQYFHLSSPLCVAGSEFTSLGFRIIRSLDRKSVVQFTIPTSFDLWNELKANPDDYEKRKLEIARQLTTWLKNKYPKVISDPEMLDVATPTTFVDYTRNYRGAWEGWLMTPTAFQTKVPKTLPTLRNFFMCGQWVEPGGGVPTVLMSGRNVVQKILSV